METILLVEDEALIAVAEARTVEGFGYRVSTALTGEKAVELALDADAGIDLVLMDMDLGGGMDGPEAARRILAVRQVPIVFLTAYGERARVELVRGITRYGYVVKNSGDFVLRSSIEMAFELFREHEKRRSSERRLSALIQTIPDLVWLKDERGVYLQCNPAFEGFFDAKEADIVGKTDYDFVDREAADAFREKDKAAMAAGGPARNEEWLTFPDGRRALFETVKTPMLDDSGRLVGVLGVSRDMTDRYALEESLKASEERVRRRLDAITEPEGDPGRLRLSDIVDVPTLTALMESFSSLTGMVVAILDIEGAVLLQTGWRDVCTMFHRRAPESAARCLQSDLFLAKNMKPGAYVDYRCGNGLWDVVTPLYIGPSHVGNIYTGQFFYDDDRVDEAAFAAEAERLGFDGGRYLEALRRVPRFRREDIARLMDFLVSLTSFVSRLSFSNLELARTTVERKRAEELLSGAVAEKELLYRELQHRVKNSLHIVSSLLDLSREELSDQGSRLKLQEAIDRIRSVSMLYEELGGSASVNSVDLGSYVGKLVDMLRTTYAASGEGCRVESRLASLRCDLKRAVPVGLVLNELVTNAIKYSRSEAAPGAIRVSLAADEADPRYAALCVSDDGPGLEPGFSAGRSQGLGLRIVGALAHDLDGEFSLAGERGARACLRFRLEAP